MSKMVEVASVLANESFHPAARRALGALDPPDARPDAGRSGPNLGAAAEDRALRTHDSGEALYLSDRIVVLTPASGTVKAQFAVQIRGRARSKPASPRNSCPSTPGPGGYGGLIRLNVLERLGPAKCRSSAGPGEIARDNSFPCASSFRRPACDSRSHRVAARFPPGHGRRAWIRLEEAVFRPASNEGGRQEANAAGPLDQEPPSTTSSPIARSPSTGCSSAGARIHGRARCDPHRSIRSSRRWPPAGDFPDQLTFTFPTSAGTCSGTTARRSAARTWFATGAQDPRPFGARDASAQQLCDLADISTRRETISRWSRDSANPLFRLARARNAEIYRRICWQRRETCSTAPSTRAGGTGPFRFEEWKTGDGTVLCARKDTGAGKAHLDRIVYRFVPDPAVASSSSSKGSSICRAAPAAAMAPRFGAAA